MKFVDDDDDDDDVADGVQTCSTESAAKWTATRWSTVSSPTVSSARRRRSNAPAVNRKLFMSLQFDY